MSALGVILVMALLFVLGAFEQAMFGFMDLSLRLEHFGAAALVAILTASYALATWERRHGARR